MILDTCVLPQLKVYIHLVLLQGEYLSYITMEETPFEICHYEILKVFHANRKEAALLVWNKMLNKYLFNKELAAVLK